MCYKGYVKMRNVIAFILSAIMSVVIVFVASLLFLFNDEKNPPDQEEIPSIELTASQSDYRNALYGFRFSLDGEEYSLPCRFDDFEKNGWQLRNPDEPVRARSNLTGVCMINGSRNMGIETVNYNDYAISCKDGQIHCVCIRPDEFNTIELHGAISFDRTVSQEYIKERFGAPDEFQKHGDNIVLTYRHENYETVKFSFNKMSSDDEQDNDSDNLRSDYFLETVTIQCRHDP